MLWMGNAGVGGAFVKQLGSISGCFHLLCLWILYLLRLGNLRRVLAFLHAIHPRKSISNREKRENNEKGNDFRQNSIHPMGESNSEEKSFCYVPFCAFRGLICRFIG